MSERGNGLRNRGKWGLKASKPDSICSKNGRIISRRLSYPLLRVGEGVFRGAQEIGVIMVKRVLMGIFASLPVLLSGCSQKISPIESAEITVETTQRSSSSAHIYSLTKPQVLQLNEWISNHSDGWRINLSSFPTNRDFLVRSKHVNGKFSYLFLHNSGNWKNTLQACALIENVSIFENKNSYLLDLPEVDVQALKIILAL